MGEGLFRSFPILTAAADDVLRTSVEALCLEDPDGRLADTAFAQPALYTVSCLEYLATIERTMERPDFTAGHSLGEYASLFAAGAFDFTTGLRLVHERGRLMGQARTGTMAAVLGLSEHDVAQILARNAPNVEIANDNTPSQLVITGPREDVNRTLPLLAQAGAKACIPLAVSGAFHSQLMRPAQQAFASTLDRARFSPPAFPVIANIDARPYEATAIPDKLLAQLTARVQWTKTMRYLLDHGVTRFHEIGGTGVLTRLAQENREAHPTAPHERPQP